ncbi:hypothetical protein AAI421_17980 [Rhodococcus aetherivorans]|uniref:hypothetical protein n=1 Tax=Rhodococcus aetherivorans TaxID=191292 RepID=UPI0031D6CE4E
MNDTRTYAQLGAALRAMPYESRELLITTTYLMAAELAMTFGWPIIAVDADGVANEIVGKLAERFDAIAESTIADGPAYAYGLDFTLGKRRSVSDEFTNEKMLEAIRGMKWGNR